MRKLLLVAICLTVSVLFSGVAYGFHDAGVAYCGGCHTMHNSRDGMAVDTLHPNGNAYLLIRATPSDVCLTCHGTSASRGVFAADPLAPGNEHGAGNFVFLTEDNINDGHNGATNPILGRAAGHNIDAPSRGVGPDGTVTTAPGGTFVSSNMECSSCHDPHGNTNFRLLYGVGDVQDGLYNFTNAAPTAIGIALGSAAVESPTNHTAYQSGFSAWCGNCHGDFHNNGTKLIHPSGSTLGGTIANNYNLYNGTADYTGGSALTAYLPQVPFEDAANTVASTAGPSAGSQVSCVTCHRAHATSGPDAGRWDFKVTIWADEGVESGSYVIPNPYNDPNQRSLCNKCHVKDEGDLHSAP